MIVDDVWNDPESERVWSSAYPTSAYQLWTVDPTSTSDAVLTLQDIEMLCVACQQPQSFEIQELRLMYSTQSTVSACSACGNKFNFHNLGAQYLKRDLEIFMKLKRWYHIHSCLQHSNTTGQEKVSL